MKFRTIIVLVTLLMAVTVSAQNKSARAEQAVTIYTDVMRLLDMSYVDSLPYERLTETAINRMLQQIDPYTVYYPKEKNKDLRMMTTGKYGGIGAIIQQRDETVNGKKHQYAIIAEPYEGMPAQKAGLQAGDRILEIDGKKMTDKAVSVVSDALRGIPHTELKVKVQRTGVAKPFVITIEREEVKLPPISYAGILQDTIAYISFSEFTENSSNEVEQAVRRLVDEGGARRLIFDLRGNGGGIIDEAVKIVNLFVGKGVTVVSTKGKIKQAERTYCTTQSARYPDLPLTVLVDRNSASASEIVAGSLQDLGRATLVGERTFGKGLVQSVRPIAYDGYLKLTTAKYYLPSGRCIQAIDYSQHHGKTAPKDTAGGILPDVIVTDTASQVDICYTLYSKQMFFDYAVRYHASHPTIATVEDFALADDDIEDFCSFLDEQQFTYETETSKFFTQMLDMAEHEDLDSLTLTELKAFAPKLQPSYRDAIHRHEEDVKRLLGAEIIQLYYYRRGREQYDLNFDKTLDRAIEVMKGE